MIDKRKNVCYVITINYWYKKGGVEEIRKHKFLSQHQITTKKFKVFVKNYFKGFPGFRGFDEEWGSQWTVSKKIWQDVKEKVLEGITEKEKCY